MSKVLIVVASLGKNAELGDTLNNICNEIELESEVLNLVHMDLPLYNSGLEEKGIPEKAKELCEKFIESRALVFVAPEYNGSVPPVLNNAICWVSRVGDNWREAFNGKNAVLATHSGGGGSKVLLAMQQQLSHIGVNVIGRQLMTSYQKELNVDSAKAVLHQLKKMSRWGAPMATFE